MVSNPTLVYLGGLLLTAVGMFVGNVWVGLGTAIAAWGLLAFGSLEEGNTDLRSAVIGGSIATVIIAGMEWLFAQAGLYFALRPEIAAFPLSLTVIAYRGVLLTGCLRLYLAFRPRWGLVGASGVTVLAAFLVGWFFETAGVVLGWWHWNALHVPQGRIGTALACIPITWAMAFAPVSYFLMPARRIASSFVPVIAGVRCGTAYVGFFLFTWSLFLRLFGKASAF